MQPNPYFYAPPPPRPPPSKWTGAIIAVSASLGGILIVAYILIAYRKDKARAEEEREDQMETCLRRGRWYYEEIGSWPKLSTGQSAEQLVIDRCSRTRAAFDWSKKEMQ